MASYLIFWCFAMFVSLEATQYSLDGSGRLTKKMGSNTTETFMGLVARAGYSAEDHEVETEDGYLLSVHRIQCTDCFKKPVVLLVHPLLGASDVWVMLGPRHDITYMLLDNGYDVWALNARGNFYSKRHKKLSPKDPEFWNFSWHEVGFYDIAATIDYILSWTHQSQLSIIGHSMGGTAELVFLSQRPEYNTKVNVAITWAPVGIVTHRLPGFIPNLLLQYGDQVETILRLFNIFEIMPKLSSDIQNFVKEFYAFCCTRPICSKYILRILGTRDLLELDSSLVPTLLQHYPQGTSLQTFTHYRQIINSGSFRQFDHGPIANYVKYHRLEPPQYPLHQISTPLIIYYGPGDHVSTKKDIEAMVKKSPSIIAKEVPCPNFGHLDFIISNSSRTILYNDVIQMLSYYGRHP